MMVPLLLYEFFDLIGLLRIGLLIIALVIIGRGDFTLGVGILLGTLGVGC